MDFCIGLCSVIFLRSLAVDRKSQVIIFVIGEWFLQDFSVLLSFELFQDRIHSYMSRVKEIQEKEVAPKLNVDASKRFVRNALWDAAHKKGSDQQQQLSASKSKSVW